MYELLNLFRTAGAAAQHAGMRQMVVAQNLANADTPGYQAMAMPAFAATLQSGSGVNLRVTRPGHLATPDLVSSGLAARTGSEASPNGNSVSVEMELLAGVEAQREHSRALAIWRHGMTVIRTSLGR